MQLGLCEKPLATERRVRTALGELERKPMLLFDEENEVLWIPNRAKHANRSPKVARAMQKEVEGMPASPLVEQFIQRYGDLLGIEL